MKIESHIQKVQPRRVYKALILLLLCWTAYSGAEPIPDHITPSGLGADATSEADTTDVLNRLDLWHARISYAIAEPVDRVDRFFADESLDDENRRSRMHASVRVRHDERDGAALLTNTRLRLVFPRIENRLQIFIDGAVTADDPGESKNIFDAVDESEPDAGLRFLFSQDERKSLSTDISARFSDPAQLFIRQRGRMTASFDQWEMRLTQTVAWFTEDGWTETSEMRWSRPLNYGFLFRSLSRVTWEEKSHGISPSQSFILFKELSPHSGYSIAVAGTWPETPDVQEANYTATLTYRRKIYRNWLFWDIATGIEFPQGYDYDPNSFITTRLELVFGE